MEKHVSEALHSVQKNNYTLPKTTVPAVFCNPSIRHPTSDTSSLLSRICLGIGLERISHVLTRVRIWNSQHSLVHCNHGCQLSGQQTCRGTNLPGVSRLVPPRPLRPHRGSLARLHKTPATVGAAQGFSGWTTLCCDNAQQSRQNLPYFQSDGRRTEGWGMVRVGDSSGGRCTFKLLLDFDRDKLIMPSYCRGVVRSTRMSHRMPTRPLRRGRCVMGNMGEGY